MKVLEKSVFVASPAEGTNVTGGSYYTTSRGYEMISIHTYSSRSDILSREFYRYSPDNGRSWEDLQSIPAGRETAGGVIRRHARAGYVDPFTGRFLKFRNQAVLPHDEVAEFLTTNTIHYTLSTDGGKTDLYDVPLIAEGDEYSQSHPLPNVTIGRNSFMLGDCTCLPITLPDGTMLLPVQISPVGPDGYYHNPGGGFTYTDCAVIRGQWRNDLSISWVLGGTVKGDPQRSTRGVIEPAIARLADGRVLMVLRGSNDTDPSLPGYRWYSISEDDGWSWSKAEPWHYQDGEFFFSPSSCSQLLSHSNGNIYWIGNVCRENPRGNHPRHPIVIGKVDQQNAALIKDSITVIDDRRPEDGDVLNISNFYAREDRERHTIILHICRHSHGGGAVFQGDCMRYEIQVD